MKVKVNYSQNFIRSPKKLSKRPSGRDLFSQNNRDQSNIRVLSSGNLALANNEDSQYSFEELLKKEFSASKVKVDSSMRLIELRENKPIHASRSKAGLDQLEAMAIRRLHGYWA